MRVSARIPMLVIVSCFVFAVELAQASKEGVLLHVRVSSTEVVHDSLIAFPTRALHRASVFNYWGEVIPPAVIEFETDVHALRLGFEYLIHTEDWEAWRVLDYSPGHEYGRATARVRYFYVQPWGQLHTGRIVLEESFPDLQVDFHKAIRNKSHHSFWWDMSLYVDTQADAGFRPPEEEFEAVLQGFLSSPDYDLHLKNKSVPCPRHLSVTGEAEIVEFSTVKVLFFKYWPNDRRQHRGFAYSFSPVDNWNSINVSCCLINIEHVYSNRCAEIARWE